MSEESKGEAGRTQDEVIPGLQDGKLTPEAKREIRAFLWKTVAAGAAALSALSALGGYAVGALVSERALSKSLDVVTDAAQHVGEARGEVKEWRKRVQALATEFQEGLAASKLHAQGEWVLAEEEAKKARNAATDVHRSFTAMLANSDGKGMAELRQIVNSEQFVKGVAELVSKDAAGLRELVAKQDAATRADFTVVKSSVASVALAVHNVLEGLTFVHAGMPGGAGRNGLTENVRKADLEVFRLVENTKVKYWWE